MATATSEKWGLPRNSPDDGHAPPDLLLSPTTSIYSSEEYDTSSEEDDHSSGWISPPSSKAKVKLRTGELLPTYSPAPAASFATKKSCKRRAVWRRRLLHNNSNKGAMKQQGAQGIFRTAAGESVGRQDAGKVLKKRTISSESVMNFLSSITSTVVLLLLFLKYQNASIDWDVSEWIPIPRRSDIGRLLRRSSSILPGRHEEAAASNGGGHSHGADAEANEEASAAAVRRPSYALLYPNRHCQGEPLRIDYESSREAKCDNCSDLCHVKFPTRPDRTANIMYGKMSIKVFGDYAAEVHKNCRGTWDYPDADAEGWKVFPSERPEGEGECAVAPFVGAAHVKFVPDNGGGIRHQEH